MTNQRRDVNYRRTGYLQSDLSDTEVSTGVGYDDQDRYRRIGHFKVAGVEKQSGATGFAYGSEKMYDHVLASNGSWNGHKLDHRT